MAHVSTDRPTEKTNWRQLTMLILLCGLLAWGIRRGGFPLGSEWFTSSANHNWLLIGDRAEMHAPHDVGLNRPAEFDFLSKATVLQFRRQAVARHPRLIARP